MHLLREKLLKLVSSGGGINRSLILVSGLAVAAVSAILVALNSPKSAPAVIESSAPMVINNPDYYVHVVGEVKSPGIYNLPADSRVFDVIMDAGGFTDRADQASINMARPLTDGEQIIVLAKGAQQNSPSFTSALISLNLANQSQLEELPGVGPTLAARMIDWRTTNGGFKRVDDLRKVTGIGAKLFAQIKPKVTL